jgi:hypothetical protein
MSTYTPIASQTLTSTAAQVTFANIPQGYTDLVLQMNTQYSAPSGAGLFFNTTGYDSLYSQTSMLGYSSAAHSGRASNTIQLTNNLVFGDSRTADIYTPSIIEIPSYSNPNVYKSLYWRYGTVITSGSDGEAGGLLGTWRKFDAINAINIFAFNINFNNAVFAIGSSFTLYGIAASGGIGSKATGGTVTTSGSYTIHTFTQSGMFVPKQALTVDYLVVAGGGGGGHAYGGGGGAGGFRTSIGGTPLSLIANTPYPAVVGSGGVAGYLSNGGLGQRSIFASITSTGGGGGATGGASGFAGGSGGGAGGGTPSTGSAGAGNTPSTSPSQGSSGGSGANLAGGGGGGGAGATGSSATGGIGGNGGNGTSSSISGSSVTYAGGGGGAGYTSGSNPSGGTGGGGNGTITGGGNGGNGTANSGGGGGSPHNGGNTAGNGGSGIVIVRYLT